MSLNFFSNGFLSLIIILSSILLPSSTPYQQTLETDPLYVPGQLIVKFETQVIIQIDSVLTNSDELNDLLKEVGVIAIEPMIQWPNDEKPKDFPEIDSYYILELPSDANILSARNALLQSESIDFVIPNYILHIDEPNVSLNAVKSENPKNISNTFIQDPNDTYYNHVSYPQWPLHNDHLQFRSAWDITTGSSDIVVAVLDTGLDTTHPDIGNKNTGTGYNFIDNSYNITDDYGHGTLVSGLIAANSNNNSGITGICWGCRIMPVKVCDSVGDCSTLDVINGMLWAANHGADIINMSLTRDILDTGYTEPATHIQQFFNYLYNNGVIVVASAGNNNENLVPPSDSNASSIIFPAAFDHVISVGAVNRYDQRCNFSQSVCGWNQENMTASGWGERLDVVAPGSVDYPSSDILGAGGYVSGDYYMYMGGTSGAAPHVAGLAALILSVNSNLSVQDVENLIEQNAVDLGIQGKDVNFGWGRINAYASVQAALPQPPSNDNIPPTGSWNTPSDGSVIHNRSVEVSVNASDNVGGSGVSEVRFSAKWGGSWYGIGTDGQAPYSINWDLCNSNVPDGDIELGMEIWDYAGNKFVWSEHGTNPHITKSYTCSGGDPVQGGPWNVQAWQNKYMAGYTNWEGTITWNDGYPYIWFDWGGGAPFEWGGDEFSMRLTRSVYFPGGYYDFHAEHDDGVRVYVDEQLTIDAWWDSHGGHDGGRTLSNGYHEVKVEYYENQGDALLQVQWYGAGYPRPDLDPPGGRITNPAHLSATNQTTLRVAADAWDDASGVDRVEFYAWYCLNDVCEWRNLYNDYSAPYYYDWEWSTIGDHHVWLDILIYDKTGKYSSNTDDWVEVDLDRTAPSIWINSPVNDQMFHGSQVPISVYSLDNQSGLNAVQFFAGYDDGFGNYWKEIGWDTSTGDNYYSLNWDGSMVPSGHSIDFFTYAYDKAGNFSSAAVWNNHLNGKFVYLPVITKSSVVKKCYDDRTLTCGSTDNWNNGNSGSRDEIDSYSCSSWNESGPEYTYKFIPTANSSATMTLSNMTSDLDVFVISQAGGTCQNNACFGYGNNTVTFNAIAGQTYYIVVDGYKGSVSDYSLSLSCQSSLSNTLTDSDINQANYFKMNYCDVVLPENTNFDEQPKLNIAPINSPQPSTDNIFEPISPIVPEPTYIP